LQIKYNAFCEKKKQYICRDTIPVNTVKVRLQMDGDVNGYEDADRCKSKRDQFWFVPSYPIAKANEDIDQLERNNRSLEVIEKVVSGSTTRRRTDPRELEKMHPLEVENEELKEAIRHMHKTNEARELQAYVEGQIAAANPSDTGPLWSDMRIALISDDFYEKKPKACFTFFRFHSWAYLKDFIESVFDVEYVPPTKDTHKQKLSRFEHCLMTLLYIESGNNLQFVAELYGYKEHSVISRIVNAWIPEWGELGRHFSVLPFITAELIDELEPEAYIKLGLKRIGAIIDGKDFYTETVRKNQTWSLPCGLNFEHTAAFLARVSEKKLNKLWCSHGRLKNVPPGYSVMGDKGFEGTTGYYPNNNIVLHESIRWTRTNHQDCLRQMRFDKNAAACEL